MSDSRDSHHDALSSTIAQQNASHLMTVGNVRMSCFSGMTRKNGACNLRDFRRTGDWLYFYVAQKKGSDQESLRFSRVLSELFQEVLTQDPAVGLVELLSRIAGGYPGHGFSDNAFLQIARFHLKDRSLECVRAGAPEAWKIQRDGTLLAALSEDGPPLCNTGCRAFDPARFQVLIDILRPGDTYYFFSEAINQTGIGQMLASAPVEDWQQVLAKILTGSGVDQRLANELTVIRMDIIDVKKALIITPENVLVDKIKAGIESLDAQFKVERGTSLSDALAKLDADLVNAVIIEDSPSAALPIDRDFTTVVVSNRAETSFESTLAGKIDLVFSEPFEMGDLIESVKNPDKHREKTWRRYTERVEVAVSMAVELTGVDDFKQGDVVNLGLGGMFIGISFPIPEIGEKVSFKLSYQTGDRQTATIEGVGVVRWVRSESSGVLRAGCGVQFLTLTEESIKNVREIVEASKTREMIPQY
jgi:hypothetical protein